MTKRELINAIKASKARSAWSKGVKVYALDMVEAVYLFNTDVVKTNEALYLNGAENWEDYSYGVHSGALAYNSDIAERLCTPGELRKTDFGHKKPNSRENWLDVQTRALYQAYRLIVTLIEKDLFF